MIVFLGLVVATLLTQIGGLVFLVCWIANRIFLRPWVSGWRRIASTIALFIGLYALGSIFLVPPLAERNGRVPLPCFEETGRPFAAGNLLLCILNRHYVDRRLSDLLAELSRAVDKTYPGTSTLFLDANFPLIAGFPLLPHLSHYDGQKVDIAYYYATPTGSYLRGQMRSPIGYWAFEQPGPNDNLPCNDRSFLTLRWDMRVLQGRFPARPLEPERTRAALNWLVNEGASFGVEKIFVEPYLAARLGVSSPLLGFQGCRAARHDDHIHIQTVDR